MKNAENWRVSNYLGNGTGLRDKLWLLCFTGVLALCNGEVHHLEVCLRELTIQHKSEKGDNEFSLGIFLVCEGDDRNKTVLGEVQNLGRAYRWEEEELSVSYVTVGGCRECTLEATGTSEGDGTLGAINICARDFRNPDGLGTYSVEGQFDATFQCKECLVVETAPNSQPLADVSNASAAMQGVEGRDVEEVAFTAQQKVVDARRGLNHSIDVKAAKSEWSAANRTKAENPVTAERPEEVVGEQGPVIRVASSHSRMSESSSVSVSGQSAVFASATNRTKVESPLTAKGPEEVVGEQGPVVRVASSHSQISESSSASVSGQSAVFTSPSTKKGSDALVAIVVALSLTSLVAGVITGALLYRSHLVRHRRRREEQMHELDEILGNPAVDFERVLQRDRLPVSRNLSTNMDQRPMMWDRIPDELD